MEKASLDAMKEAGVEINDVDDKKPFQAAVKPVWDKYGAAAPGADPADPGREVRRTRVPGRRCTKLQGEGGK